MVKRRFGYKGSSRNKIGSIAGGKAGKMLVRQIIVCVVIVLLAIVIKKMDHAMTNRALDTVQTFMQQDFSGMETAETAKSVFSQLGNLPDAVASAIEDGKKQMDFIQPSNEESLAMTFGGDQSYEGMKYSSEKEMQVYASSGGTVIAVEGNDGNQRIRISHGGSLETQYAGCSKVYVSPLEKVRKGQLIGSIAPGAQSCLTFSMWKGGESLNPADYIQF